MGQRRFAFPRSWVTLGLLLLGSRFLGAAGEMVTREYRLKHLDAPDIIQVINFAIANPTGHRIMGGNGRKLVVTDAIGPQDDIADLLPVIDKPTSQTDPRRIHMELVMRAANYLQIKKKSESQATTVSASAPAASSGDTSGPVHTYDIRKSTMAYKSVYSDEDEKLTRKPRIIQDDPVLPSTGNLVLKGIFRAGTGSPLAMMSYETTNFTARDGGLFENNRTRVKGVTTQIFKDHVMVTGPDRIPRKIQFKSSL